MALGHVDPALKRREAGEGFVDPHAGRHLAHPGAVVGALQPGDDGALASTGLAQPGFELGDIEVGGAERVVEQRDLAFEVPGHVRSEEHTSELQSLMRISYAVFCLKKKKTHNIHNLT